MWTIYRVRWEFITQLCASVPGKSELIEAWVNARAPRVRPPDSKSLDEIANEVIETLATPEQAPDAPSTLVFQRIPFGGRRVLATRIATVKAHLKDCAYQLQTYTAGYVQGDKSFRSRVANNVYPAMGAPLVLFHGTPYVVIFGPDGQPMTEPNGIRVTTDGDEDGLGPREKPIHVMTPMGPRNALKAFEFCEGAVMEFRLAVVTAPTRQVKRAGTIAEVDGRAVVNEDDLKTLMLYGGMHGYAGERSEDGGRYAFTITEEESNG